MGQIKVTNLLYLKYVDIMSLSYAFIKNSRENMLDIIIKQSSNLKVLNVKSHSLFSRKIWNFF